MKTLFPVKGDFRIVRLRETDAIRKSDHLKTFAELVLENAPMYPGIQDWMRSKVLPGLKSNERVAYVGYEGEHPIITAVLKRGRNAKFCHLRIHEDFQDIDLGQVFFTQMAFEIRNIAKEVHFTLPESLWLDKQAFFKSFGFQSATKAVRQYRHGENELICSAPFSSVWRAVIEKLPTLMKKFVVGGFAMDNRMLMSIKPDFAQKIIRGEKIVEIRRQFSKKWCGCRITLYASKPTSALVGEATVEKVSPGRPIDIWREYGNHIGCTKQEFDSYAEHHKKIFAIELGDALPYLQTIPLDQATHLLDEELRPPQSYLSLQNNEGWAKAVSVAAFLHGSIGRKSINITLANEEQPSGVFVGND